MYLVFLVSHIWHDMQDSLTTLLEVFGTLSTFPLFTASRKSFWIPSGGASVSPPAELYNKKQELEDKKWQASLAHTKWVYCHNPYWQKPLTGGEVSAPVFVRPTHLYITWLYPYSQSSKLATTYNMGRLSVVELAQGNRPLLAVTSNGRRN